MSIQNKNKNNEYTNQESQNFVLKWWNKGDYEKNQKLLDN